MQKGNGDMETDVILGDSNDEMLEVYNKVIFGYINRNLSDEIHEKSIDEIFGVFH